MNPERPGGRHRLLPVLLGLVMSLLLGIAAATPAHAEDQPVLTASLDSLTVADEVATMQVTISNTGTIPAYGVQAMMWRSRDPIRDLTALRAASTPTTVWGSRLWNTTSYALVTASTVPFEPGTTRTVTLSASFDQLGFDTADAAYTLGVQVIGTGDQSSNYLTLAEARTFLTWVDEETVPLTTAVLLSAPPTRVLPDLFADDSLVEQLSGRLTALLEAARTRSWVIDPALLEAVTDMADGYQVVQGDQTALGTGQAVASQWLTRFAELPLTHGARTLYANPDLAATEDEGVRDWVRQASDTTDRLKDLPLVAWPAGNGRLTTDSYQRFGGVSADAVITTNASRAPALQAGRDSGPPVLAASTTLATRPQGLSDLQLTQLLQAETFVSHALGQFRLITDPAAVALDTAATTSWMTVRPLGALLTSTPAPRQVSFTRTETGQLTTSQVEAAARSGQIFATYADLVPESRITSHSAGFGLRALAGDWVTEPAGQEALLTSLAARIGPPALSGAVSIDASSRFVMSSKQNAFPISIRNDLQEAIRVKVRVESDNLRRLRIPDSQVVTVRPGQSQTVEIRPEADSNGIVTAKAFLVTEQGNRIGQPRSITIEATDLGLVGWVIVIVSGLVVIAATTLRVRQVRRRTSLTEAAATQDDHG